MLDIRNEIANISEIVPIPATVTLILAQTLQGESAGTKLIKLIDADAVLTAIVLRAANSAFYSLRGGVSTVQHAVMMLGHAEISRLVLAYEMKQRIFSLNPEQKEYLNRLWLHSLSTASAARIIATMLRLPSVGEEFTAGLLHDMGKIVLAQHFSYNLIKSQEMVSQLFLTDLEAEQQLFAIAHTEIGGQLAANWNLPGVIIDTMRHHHNPAYPGPHQAVTAVVRLADLFAEQWNFGIGERAGAFSAAEDPCWSVMTELFPSLAAEPFDAFEESVRLEFENNMAFSELFT